jgi:hypothetical protein
MNLRHQLPDAVLINTLLKERQELEDLLKITNLHVEDRRDAEYLLRHIKEAIASANERLLPRHLKPQRNQPIETKPNRVALDQQETQTNP